MWHSLSTYWRASDISAEGHRLGNVTALAAYPDVPMRELMAEVFGDWERVTQVLKVRLYLHASTAQHSSVVTMPKWALGCLQISEVEHLLEALEVPKEARAVTPLGRYRQAQYCMSYSFGELFFDSLPQDLYVERAPDLNIDEARHHVPSPFVNLLTSFFEPYRRERSRLWKQVAAVLAELPGEHRKYVVFDTKLEPIVQAVPYPKVYDEPDELIPYAMRHANLLFLDVVNQQSTAPSTGGDGTASYAVTIDQLVDLVGTGTNPAFARHCVVTTIDLLNDAGIAVPAVRAVGPGLLARVFRPGENAKMACDAAVLGEMTTKVSQQSLAYEIAARLAPPRVDLVVEPSADERRYVDERFALSELATGRARSLVHLAETVSAGIGNVPEHDAEYLDPKWLASMATAILEGHTEPEPLAGRFDVASLSYGRLAGLLKSRDKHAWATVNDVAVWSASCSSLARGSLGGRARNIVAAFERPTSTIGLFFRARYLAPTRASRNHNILRRSWIEISELKRQFLTVVLPDSDGSLGVPAELEDVRTRRQTALTEILRVFANAHVSARQTREWLKSPVRALDGRTAIDAILEEGASPAVPAAALDAAMAFRG